MMPWNDPFAAFDAWFGDAEHHEPSVADAMQLTTVDTRGRPSLRTVLLKAHGPGGFVFFTNSHSRKGREMAENPHVAALMHWKSLERQVIIEGKVVMIDDNEADAYFATRPRGSQLGAWASAQSEPLDTRETLERRVASLAVQLDGRPIPRPRHWNGYRIRPRRIEFWQGMPNRLHQRTEFLPTREGWVKALLQP